MNGPWATVAEGQRAPYALREVPGVVGRIAARKLGEVRRRASAQGPLAPRADEARGFEAALRAPELALIAELKPRSPSRGPIRPDASAADAAAWYGPRAHAISVLCDGQDFGGSLALLGEVRSLVSQPVLCKDFVVSPYQIVEASARGADAILLMCSLLPPHELKRALALCAEVGIDALVETHDEAELDEALNAGATVIGVNARDLRTLEIDVSCAARLLGRLPSHVVRVAESGLHSSTELDLVRPVSDACLVGTSLMSAEDPGLAAEALGWARREVRR